MRLLTASLLLVWLCAEVHGLVHVAACRGAGVRTRPLPAIARGGPLRLSELEPLQELPSKKLLEAIAASGSTATAADVAAAAGQPIDVTQRVLEFDLRPQNQRRNDRFFGMPKGRMWPGVAGAAQRASSAQVDPAP